MTISADDVWDAVQPRLQKYHRNNGDLALVAEFTDSKPGTVLSWLGSGRATGDRLIKLWHLLSFAGLTSPELGDLDGYNRFLGELYAFGVLDIDQVLKALNVRLKNAALDAMRGRTPANRTFYLKDLKLQYGEDLEQAKAKLASRLTTLNLVDTATPSAPVPSQTTVQSTDEVDALSATTMAGTLQHGLVLLRYLASGRCPEQQRALVVELTGGFNEFTLLIANIGQHTGS